MPNNVSFEISNIRALVSRLLGKKQVKQSSADEWKLEL